MVGHDQYLPDLCLLEFCFQVFQVELYTQLNRCWILAMKCYLFLLRKICSFMMMCFFPHVRVRGWNRVSHEICLYFWRCWGVLLFFNGRSVRIMGSFRHVFSIRVESTTFFHIKWKLRVNGTVSRSEWLDVLVNPSRSSRCFKSETPTRHLFVDFP